MVRAMCGVQLKDRNRSKHLMFGLNDTVDHLAWQRSYGHVLRDGSHVWRKASDFEVRGQRKKGGSIRTCKLKKKAW